MRLGGRHGALLAELDPLDEVGGELLEVLDARDVLAVLRVVLEPAAEAVEGGDAEEVHVAVRRPLDGVEDEAERQAQRDHGDQAVLDDAAEELCGDVQLLLGVLRKVLVLLEEVLDHAGEHLALALHRRVLELFEQLEHLVDGEGRVRRLVVDLLEVPVRLVLHLPRDRTGHLREDLGDVALPDLLDPGLDSGAAPAGGGRRCRHSRGRRHGRLRGGGQARQAWGRGRQSRQTRS